MDLFGSTTAGQIGNICGGMGWFRGSKNDNIDAYDCYQFGTSWAEGQGIDDGPKDYQGDPKTETTGHCWTGYHPVDHFET